MSGRRPDASRSWNFINHFREDHPEWTSLPGLFLRAGAKAWGAGKSYHPKLPPQYDTSKSWSPEALPYKNPCWNTADTNINSSILSGRSGYRCFGTSPNSCWSATLCVDVLVHRGSSMDT